MDDFVSGCECNLLLVFLILYTFESGEELNFEGIPWCVVYLQLVVEFDRADNVVFRCWNSSWARLSLACLMLTSSFLLVRSSWAVTRYCRSMSSWRARHSSRGSSIWTFSVKLTEIIFWSDKQKSEITYFQYGWHSKLLCWCRAPAPNPQATHHPHSQQNSGAWSGCNDIEYLVWKIFKFSALPQK